MIIKCLYGIEDVYRNVTDIVKEKFMKEDIIEIPQYTVFNDYFNDVVKNELKTLTININNKKILISEDDIQKRSYKIDKEGNIYYKQNSQFRVIFGNRQQQTDITHRIKTKFYKEDKIIIQQDLDFRIEFGNAGNIGLYDNDMIILFPNKHYIINERDVYDKEYIIDTKTAKLYKKLLSPIPIDYQKYKVPNWTPKKDSKIYLIANNKDIDTNIFKIIKEDDLVVFFNLNYFGENFKNHKNKVIILRVGHDYTWFGYKINFNKNYLCSYFLTGYKTSDYNNFEDNKMLINDKILVSIMKDINFPNNQTVMTGLFSYYFLKNIYTENKIIMLGFTCTSDGWFGHNDDWEYKHCFLNNIPIINSLTKIKKYPIINTIIGNLDSDYPIFCCFYTSNNGYKKYADRLIESLNKFNLPHVIYDLNGLGDNWIELCQLKPHVLKIVMDKYPNKNIVWSDSDSIIEKEPILLKNIPNNFAVHYINNDEFASGTLYFQNNNTSREILYDWIIVNQQNPNAWDQVTLGMVINKTYKKYEYILPKEYCSIFDHQNYQNIDRVISQWQASRELKFKNRDLYKNIYPLSYSIPEEKIKLISKNKINIISPLIPGKLDTYIYNTEYDYYKQYEESKYAITTKKNGWDCLRHYEILASNCIPLFPNLDNCPNKTLTTLPKNVLIKIYKEKDNISEEKYNEYIQYLNDYTKKYLTCKSSAKYILKTINFNYNNDSKILMINNNLIKRKWENYTQFFVTIGLRKILKNNFIDYPKNEVLYKNYDSINYYGKGFTYSNILDNIDIDRTNIINRIKNKEFNIIIYGLMGAREEDCGDIRLKCPLWEEVRSVYKQDEIIFLYGGDGLQCKENERFFNHLLYHSRYGHCFVRELDLDK